MSKFIFLLFIIENGQMRLCRKKRGSFIEQHYNWAQNRMTVIFLHTLSRLLPSQNDDDKLVY